MKQKNKRAPRGKSARKVSNKTRHIIPQEESGFYEAVFVLMFVVFLAALFAMWVGWF